MSGSSRDRKYKLKIATILVKLSNDDQAIGFAAVPMDTVCTCVRRRNVPRAHGYGSRNSVEEYGASMVEDQGFVVNCMFNGSEHTNLLLLDSDIAAGRAVRVRAPKSVRSRRIARRSAAASRRFKSRKNHRGPVK
jgi:hypothetical protein